MEHINTKKSKTSRSKTGIINGTQKSHHRNYMKETASFSNKKNIKFDLNSILPRMNFSKTSNSSQRTSVKKLSQTLLRSNSQPLLLNSHFETDMNYEDTFNHFNDKSYGSDPYDHFS
jgi:hypothetical protein